MITKVDVKSVEFDTVATFTWNTDKEYWGWEALRNFCRTLDYKNYTLEFSFQKEDQWPTVI